MLIMDDQVAHALRCLQDWEAAKARAAHEFMDDMTKTILAQLGDECEEKSQAAKEAYARSHPKFIEHLKGKQKLAELDYKHRQRLAASAAIIDLFRTEQASNRKLDRL